MAAKPSKYPTIDPRLPDLYGRILKAASAMRTARQAENEVQTMLRRMERVASLRPVPTLTPDSAVSGVSRPVLAESVRVAAAKADADLIAVSTLTDGHSACCAAM